MSASEQKALCEVHVSVVLPSAWEHEDGTSLRASEQTELLEREVQELLSKSLLS